MCDTFWKKTETGSIFAKNSDRGCNEPNLTLFVEGGKTKEKTLNCTYIEIPQAERVNSVLLVKPSWMWGAEIGVNEHGVSIGNEAVFTKSKGKKEKRLLGMDMLRLALERADTSANALDLVISLLKKYGQGGNCGFEKSFYYDNSFLFADKNEAYILETAGSSFVVKKLDKQGNISNRLSLDGEFIKNNREPVFTFFSGSKQRERKGCQMLSDARDLQGIFEVLRAHNGEDDGKLFLKGSLKSVCMHQSALGDHTTGSIAVTYGKDMSIWATGSSTPCLSVFKPVVFGQATPPVFTDEKQSLNYWLTREYLARAIFCGHIELKSYKEKARELEKEFVKKYQDAVNAGADNARLVKICKECSDAEAAFVDGFADIIDGVKSGRLPLIKPWDKRTRNLGQNAFYRDLKERKGK
jgi:secernin